MRKKGQVRCVGYIFPSPLLTEIENLPLTTVAKIFKEKGFQVKNHKDVLTLKKYESPTFTMQYSKGNYLLKNNEIEKKTQRKFRQFKAKYEVSFDNLQDVLQEYTTLGIIQEILIDKIGGIIFLKWNGRIIE